MSGLNKSSIPRQSSYNALCNNHINELKHNRNYSEGGSGGGTTTILPLGAHMSLNSVTVFDNKENAMPNKPEKSELLNKENAVPNINGTCGAAKEFPSGKLNLKDRVLKPSSLQLCMQIHEPDSTNKSKILVPIDSDSANSGNIWDYSDSEAAPASSWSTVPNRSLLCRPLPVDIGRCTCVIVKEASPDGGTLYSLYTNEGQGRQDRKLAMANHRRRNGRSEFIVAQNTKGLLHNSDDGFIGTVTANLIGSKYHIWNQGSRLTSATKHSKQLLAAVNFMPTISTWMGSYRSIKAWIPKHQSMQLKNITQMQHINGLPEDWEDKMNKVHQLFSRVPHYNKISKQYELDFRDRGRTGLRIQSSIKNFQLTLEGLSYLEEWKADNPSTRKGGEIEVCDGLQVNMRAYPFCNHIYCFKQELRCLCHIYLEGIITVQQMLVYENTYPLCLEYWKSKIS